MNWVTLLLQLAPYVILGVEKVHADLSGPGKRQAAHDALTAATAGALAAGADPEITVAANKLTGVIIDQTVADLHTQGLLTHTGSQPSADPAPAVVTVPGPVAQGDGDPATSDAPVPAVPDVTITSRVHEQVPA